MRTSRRPCAASCSRARTCAAISVVAILLLACSGGTLPNAGRSSTASSAGAQTIAPSGGAGSSPTHQVEESPSGTAATPAPGAAGALTGRWEPAGTMSIDRASTHALLLTDGRVLVVGSEAAMGNLNAGEESPPRDDTAIAEVWDPITNTWRRTAGLNRPRSDFVAVPLQDGRVLVTGGLDQGPMSYSSSYLFDPGPGHESWSRTGLLDTARTAAAAAVLPDGRVLVAGGYYDGGAAGSRAPDAVVAAYRPASAPGPRSGEPPVNDVSPSFIVPALATAELFDPATGTWSATGSMRYARMGAAAVTLADGRVLVVGSASYRMIPSTLGGAYASDWAAYTTAEVWDPETGRFSLTGTFPEIDRAWLASRGVWLPAGDPGGSEIEFHGVLVALADGGALLVGYTSGWKHQATIVRTFRFDATTDRWSEVGTPTARVWNGPAGPGQVLGDSRTDALVARLAEGRILVAGGDRMFGDEQTFEQSTELYDPATDAWTSLPPMPEPRAGGAAVALPDGSVLVVGGYGASYKGLASAIRFVPGSR